MKRKLCVFLAFILMISGTFVFFYPSLSKLEVQRENNEITEQFDRKTEEVQEGSIERAIENDIINEDGYLINENGETISEYPVVFQQDIDRLYADSVAYNDRLKEHQDMENADFTDSAVNLADYGIYDGVYGYISAPSIGLNAPIYLGASDSHMAWGAAHLMNTSLPTGGKNTNVVLAGHTGYFGRVVFDNIPYLSKGDTVSITTYFGTLNYQVVLKKEIKATETNDSYIVKEKDLLTLLTCAKMGRARYQVTCERV